VSRFREDFLRIAEENGGVNAVEGAWKFYLEKHGCAYCVAEVEFLYGNDPAVIWTGKKYEVKRVA